MEKHGEQEIISLLTEIRSKRDLSSFANSNQLKNGKVVNPKPIVLEETTEMKTVENAPNMLHQAESMTDGTSRDNREGGMLSKKQDSKVVKSKVIRSEMGDELGQFPKQAHSEPPKFLRMIIAQKLNHHKNHERYLRDHTKIISERLPN